MDANMCLIELAQKRGELDFSLRRIEQSMKTVQLNDDDPKALQCRFGGGIQISVLSALNVYLKQQVMRRIWGIKVNPLLKAKAIWASIDIQPFLVKYLIARNEGCG